MNYKVPYFITMAGLVLVALFTVVVIIPSTQGTPASCSQAFIAQDKMFAGLSTALQGAFTNTPEQSKAISDQMTADGTDYANLRKQCEGN